MTVTYRFERIVLGGRQDVYCPCCNKKRKKAITRVYYKNPFIDQEATRQKLQEELRCEREHVFSNGAICSKCRAQGKVPPERWIRPVPRPFFPKPFVAKLYLECENNTYWRVPAGWQKLEKLVAPTTQRPLLQLPCYPDSERLKDALDFPPECLVDTKATQLAAYTRDKWLYEQYLSRKLSEKGY